MASRHKACLDCPPVRLGVLNGLVESPAGCVFVKHNVAARDRLPLRWFTDFDFGLVRRGVVIRERVDIDGRCIAVDFVGPGSLVPLGHDGDWSPSLTAYAATDVAVCLLTRESLIAHERSGCYRELHSLEAKVLDRMERLIEARGRPTATERLASLLCMLADSLSCGSGEPTLPPGLRRSDMAALLGMRRETLSRALSRLATQGMIRRDVDGLRIMDRRTLERAGAPRGKRTSGIRIRAGVRDPHSREADG